MLDLRVERISLWLCLLVCLAGVICGATNPPHPSFVTGASVGSVSCGRDKRGERGCAARFTLKFGQNLRAKKTQQSASPPTKVFMTIAFPRNLIKSVTQGTNTRNTPGDAKMIYESGGCVQFSSTSGRPYMDVRLYDTHTVRTVLLYLPPGAEPSNIQMKAGSGLSVLTPFSKTDWPVTKEYSVYRWEGDVSAYNIRVAANQTFSICFMKVYDKTLKDYCECGDACHRNADVVCSGVCSKAIPDNCRMENVALKKIATMSTGHKGSIASSAVNGVTGTTFSASGYNNDTTLWNCIQTAAGDNSPTWTVDLGQSYDFKHVTIYRRDTQKGRMKDVQIKVGDKVCKTITWYDALSDRMDLDCDEVMRGRMVTLTRSYDFLNFCEFQIWVCKPGYYGSKCSSNCSGHCEGNSVCDGIDGTCPGECEPGWYTVKCNVKCNSGCSDNGCDKSSGNCFECRANFAGNKCEDCDNAHYGTDCSKECGHCSKKNTPCGRQYGRCTWDGETGRYCEAGYQQPICTETCADGFHGNCTTECGRCASDPVTKDIVFCDKESGFCPHECEENFVPPLCAECSLAHYGMNCMLTCSIGCENSQCDSVSGHCICRPGWKESNPKCIERCDPGSYGKNCSQRCGQGCANICSNEMGFCSCISGFQSPLCQSESDEQDYKTLTISMTAVVIFVFCILVGLIVSLSVLFRRHRWYMYSRPAPCSSPKTFVLEKRDVPPQGVVGDDDYIDIIPNEQGTSTAGETGAAPEDQAQTHYEAVL